MSSLDTDYLIGSVAMLAGTTLALTADAHLRQGQHIFENLTVAKVERAVLYALGSLVPIVTAITSKETPTTLLSLMGSALCVLVASHIRDYDDAKELHIMKALGERMSFRELKQTHGLPNLIKYHLVDDLSAKFTLAYSALPFSAIVEDHPLEQIAQYQLAPIQPTGFLHDKFILELSARKWAFLRERDLANPLYTSLISIEMYTSLNLLQNKLKDIDTNYEQTVRELDIAYSERTDMLLKKFAERERNIPNLARELRDKVTSQANGNGVGNAIVDSVIWRETTSNILHSASNGFSIADAAGRYAEQAELERLRAELQRDRENPITIVRGAQEQKAFDQAVFNARLQRDKNVAQLEDTLAEIISRN